MQAKGDLLKFSSGVLYFGPFVIFLTAQLAS